MPTPRGRYADYADELRKEPGRWAAYPGAVSTAHPSGMLYALKHDNAGYSFPAAEFEFRCRDKKIQLRFRIRDEQARD